MEDPLVATATFSLFLHCCHLSVCLARSSIALTSDVEHAVDVGGAADGPAAVPAALPLLHARAVPLLGVGVRLEKGRREVGRKRVGICHRKSAVQFPGKRCLTTLGN